MSGSSFTAENILFSFNSAIKAGNRQSLIPPLINIITFIVKALNPFVGKRKAI
jgi:hypothetical protein